MKRIFLVCSFSLLLIFLGHAHEFWLQPNTFFAQPGQLVPVEVLVGEHFQGERSEGKKNRILQYAHWIGKTREDIAPQLTEGHYGSVPIKLATPGTHLIALANSNKYLEMRADSFLLYLKEDGLDQVIQWRTQHSQTQRRSREFYRRCVKTLIQVGPLTTNDQTYCRNTGMPLEIIPVENPYHLKPGGLLELTILFQNKPLAGALVRYWNRPSNQQSASADFTEQQQRSDQNGHVQFALKAGNNMVSLVQMVPYANTKQADWQSYWGSLTFGCR